MHLYRYRWAIQCFLLFGLVKNFALAMSCSQVCGRFLTTYACVAPLVIRPTSFSAPASDDGSDMILSISLLIMICGTVILWSAPSISDRWAQSSLLEPNFLGWAILLSTEYDFESRSYSASRP